MALDIWSKCFYISASFIPLAAFGPIFIIQSEYKHFIDCNVSYLVFFSTTYACALLIHESYRNCDSNFESIVSTFILFFLAIVMVLTLS